ncbi:transmembrane protein 44 [Labrus mixtus]|uniref:transmembrane protein 44 n=1 Tax=Labrus mixtus TaxID=508554 RepID=UPI0029C0ACE4|nr:transmembrane protein 44 [Labrus mixtus]
MSTINMRGHKASTENTNTSLSSLLDFCADTISTCLSSDADKLCASIGLNCLSALLVLLSCILLVCQRCRTRRQNTGETFTSLYSFLGNLCNTVGAVLSSQLYILIIMGTFASAVDFVHVISSCLPVLLCWNSQSEKRQRMIRSRRRQYLLSMCVLMMVGGGILKSRVTLRPLETSLPGRKLLHVTLQDNTEVLGYILGLLSFVVSCTSRFPSLSRAYRGQMLTWPYVYSGLMCSLAGALYAAAILVYDTNYTFVLRVLPWLLSALCCVCLDLLILVMCWCRKGTRRQLHSFSLDTESLLGCSGLTSEDNAVMNRHAKQQVNSSAQTETEKKQKITEMGRYIDMSVQPASKTWLKEVMLSKEEMADRPLHRTVRVVRVNGFSSDTSYDSSLESSDLEWDFEEANAQWNEPTAKQRERAEFPLVGWPKHPKPCKLCTCATSGPPQRTLCGNDDQK